MRVRSILWLITMTAHWTAGFGQGWVAEIDVSVAHDFYAYEKINRVILTYSGITMNDYSENGEIHFTIFGNYPIEGTLTAAIDGYAWEPYDPSHEPGASVRATYSGTHTSTCEKTLFESQGASPLEHFYIWIRVHPRMEISPPVQNCEQLTLTSPTCAPFFKWEVGESILGDFRVIEGQSSSSIIVSPGSLSTLGFTEPYGRKYFRVTGLENTTSELQVVDIYYPGPTIEPDISPPLCHKGSDGQISLTMTSALPDTIDDFVVTVFRENRNPIRQVYVNNSANIRLDGFAAGSYTVKVENSSNIQQYGNCWTELTLYLPDPGPVTVSASSVSDYHGYGVSCHGAKDGSIEIQASGGTGSFSTYQWNPSISNSFRAERLGAGTYQVKIVDSNGCWSAPYEYTLTQPKELISLAYSFGGRNGFDVSCADKQDGTIRLNTEGGVQPYQYKWSDGDTLRNRDNLSAGNYAVTVMDLNGCITNTSITLIAPEPISFTLVEHSGVRCPGENTGDLEVQNLQNIIGNASVQWSSGESTLRIRSKGAGLYLATVSDDQGCSATMEHRIAEPPRYHLQVLEMTDYNGTPLRCHDSEDASIRAVVFNESGIETTADQYRWFRNGVQIPANGPGNELTNVGRGVYSVEGYYRNSCRIEASILIEGPPPLTATIIELDAGIARCSEEHRFLLRADAEGGVKEYSFEWNDGTSSPEIQSARPGFYFVTVRDANDCVTTVSHFISEPFQPDLALEDKVLLCPEAVYQVDPGPGWASFTWGDSERTYAGTDPVTRPGSYWVEAIDGFGCVARDTFHVAISNEPLDARFLLPSMAYILDTVVSIDITWPVPSQSTWHFPQEMTLILAQDNLVFSQFAEAGTYEVSLVAEASGCTDSTTKTIVIHEREAESHPSGRAMTSALLNTFSVYPNPNEGEFEVDVRLNQESPITITIANAVTAKIIAVLRDEGSARYVKRVSLGSLQAGIYSLKLEHAFGTLFTRMVVH